MNKSIKCLNCGKEIDLKAAIYDELKSDFDKNVTVEVDNKTKDLTEQVGTLTKLMQKYMGEAGTARAKATELQMQLSAADKIADIKLNEELSKEREKIGLIIQQEVEYKSSKINESADLKVKEKSEIINQLEKQLSTAQQRIRQGLTQAQGESQELYIEEFLKKEFPLDTIEEIKRGAAGADCIQIVNTRTKLNIGTIYIESKLTKSFNKSWLDKFKKDMRDKGVNTGILVSSARPTGIKRATIIKGVWVCNLEEFKIITRALRETICKTADIISMQENKGDKKEMLYTYLISDEFKMQVDAIIEGFSTMQEDLMSEKRSMNMIWNRREKQITKVIDSTIGMYGSIKGIGGNSIQDIPSLQLGE